MTKKELNIKIERMSDNAFLVLQILLAAILAVCGSACLLFVRSSEDGAGLNITGLTIAILICAGVPKLLEYEVDRKMTKLIRLTAGFIAIILIVYCVIRFT